MNREEEEEKKGKERKVNLLINDINDVLLEMSNSGTTKAKWSQNDGFSTGRGKCTL